MRWIQYDTTAWNYSGVNALLPVILLGKLRRCKKHWATWRIRRKEQFLADGVTNGLYRSALHLFPWQQWKESSGKGMKFSDCTSQVQRWVKEIAGLTCHLETLNTDLFLQRTPTQTRTLLTEVEQNETNFSIVRLNLKFDFEDHLKTSIQLWSNPQVAVSIFSFAGGNSTWPCQVEQSAGLCDRSWNEDGNPPKTSTLRLEIFDDVCRRNALETINHHHVYQKQKGQNMHKEPSPIRGLLLHLPQYKSVVLWFLTFLRRVSLPTKLTELTWQDQMPTIWECHTRVGRGPSCCCRVLATFPSSSFAGHPVMNLSRILLFKQCVRLFAPKMNLRVDILVNCFTGFCTGHPSAVSCLRKIVAPKSEIQWR